MLIWPDIGFAVVGAVIVMFMLWAFAAASGRRAAPGALFVFLLAFPLLWALGVWLTPFGPSLWGGYVFPYVLGAVLLGMLFATLATAMSPVATVPHTDGAEEPEEKAVVFFGFAFWALVLLAVLAVVARYLA